MGRRLSVLCAVLLACAGLCAGRQLHQSLPAQTPLQKVQAGYLNNTALFAHMHEFATRCSSISKLHQIGKSVRGEPLLVLELSNKPGQEEAKPNFLYIANMHGTEPGGRQLLLTLAEWLCASYPSNAVAQRVVNNMHLYLMPTMNPDGFTDNQYENANFVNLNRDFPDPIQRKGKGLAASGREQPETAAVMNFFLSRPFTAAANMHEGAFVANYPYDGTPSGITAYNPTPDDGTFRFLARTYASRHIMMANSTEFPGGITNGGAWYPIYGGMQDWSYLYAGAFQITLELWDVKGTAPPRTLWAQNRDPMIQYALWSTLGGLRGTVRRRGTLAPLEARITVGNSTTVTRSTKLGDFYRPLAPADRPYLVRVTVPALNWTQSFNVTVPTSGRGSQLNVVVP